VIEFFSSLVDAVTEAPPIWRNLIAGFAIMLETSIFLGLVIPGDTVVILASTMVLDWGDFAFLLMSVLIGSLIGETIGFFIGRFFGPKLRHSKLGRKIGEKNWVLADKLVAKRGGVAVFISRFLPVLHSVVPAVAGMTKMPYKVFISWTFAACTIWASMYVGVGYLARASFDQLSDNLRVASFVGIGILLLFMLLVFIGKKLLNNYAHKED
jgi:membrane protein DedA with SNARE-associated domain